MRAMNLEKISEVEFLTLFNLPIPFSYRSLRVEEGHRPIGFRFSEYIVNIVANLDGREFIVCGEAETRELACAKAFSELIERSVLISNTSTAEALTSNGWAAHPFKAQAQNNAILELVERDAVLAQWYSSTPFLRMNSADLPMEIQNWATLELARSEFPKLVLLLSTKGLGPSVTCLLVNEQGFGVSAHCAKEDFDKSVIGAIAEACRAAHSAIRKEHWRDSLKLKDGVPDLVDPSAHGVYYAYHEPFPDWMLGETIAWSEASVLWQKRTSEALADSNFSFQQLLELPVCVGYAKHPNAFDLSWERTDKEKVVLSAGAKRLNLKSETINEKPHIVS